MPPAALEPRYHGKYSVSCGLAVLVRNALTRQVQCLRTGPLSDKKMRIVSVDQARTAALRQVQPLRDRGANEPPKS